MPDNQKIKTGCTWLQLTTLGVIFTVLVLGAIPSRGRIGEKARMAATAGNCRQILTALNIHAADHDGQFPDSDKSNPSTSNGAFAVLIRDGIVNDERMFGSPMSKYFPDNIIGVPPNFEQALEAYENHWAMTRGVDANNSPDFPLIFENPTEAIWPPEWNCDATGKTVKGRTWKGGKIIVGLKDGTVRELKLASSVGLKVPPERESDGKNIFSRANDTMEVLDVLGETE